MPYKDKTKHLEAVKRVNRENAEILKKAKLYFGIPLDRRKKHE